ncbi:MAG: hypothetical protein LQ347_001471 [Umbilicaria vellea]|nr:MAG: hypothetical protein LQ347_001471 [Umbilicaria vellea]
MEERGVPVVISVRTDWVKEERVEVAARERAVIMLGPGKMCAFVMCAQWAMRRGPEAGDGAVGEVVDDVGVRFQHANGVAHFFCEFQEGGGGGDIGGDAQIGALNGDQLEQIRG